MALQTFVRVTDLCGRDDPYITDASNLDDAIRDVIYDCDSDTCYMGEMQYDFLRSDDPELLSYLASCDE